MDTVNNIVSIDGVLQIAAIVGLLNSRLINWLAYRFLYNKAVRTMHFDQYFLDKIPLPCQFVSIQSQLVELVLQIQNQFATSPNQLDIINRLVEEVDNIVFDCYAVTDDEREMILAEFPSPDL